MASRGLSWRPIQCGQGSARGGIAAFSLAPSYYPGTLDGASAEAVGVGLGSEIAGIALSMQPGGLARVRGVVVDGHGQPARGSHVALVDVASGTAGAAPVRQDGSFTLENVAPGDYALSATRTNPQSGERQMVQQTLSVAGADIDGIMLPLGPGGSIAGVIIMDDGVVPGLGTESLHVRVVPIAGSLPTRMTTQSVGGSTFLQVASAGAGQVAPDFSFSIAGVGGAFLLQARPLPEGWMQKQVLWRGQDVSDTGLRLAGTEGIAGVQIVLTRRTTAIQGMVTDANEQPVADYTVIASADDRARWRPHSRYFGIARPDQQGRFPLRNLPAGEHLIAAADWVEEGTEEDPELLESLRSSAVRIELGEGEHRAVTVPLTVPRQ